MRESGSERIFPRWIREPTRFDAAVPSVDVTSRAQECPFERAGLLPGLAAALRRKGINQLFPVQAAVIPRLLRGHGSPMHPGDVCVSAPTGSGKTLAYVLPIVQSLSTRVVRRIRAVVVLPNRDLVGQVKMVFDTYAGSITATEEPATKLHRAPLRIAALSGQLSFAKERALLRVDGVHGRDGESRVDVVVATPGRLVDHIRGVDGISMEHVQVLVVDEADRLLSQSYSEWLPTFLAAAHRPSRPLAPSFAERPFSPGFTVRQPTAGVRPVELNSGRWVRKLLFSATLSHDPEQLASLGLVFPTLYVADSRTDQTTEGSHPEYSTPTTLTEHMVVCGAQHKPLVVLHFLLVRRCRRALVFVASRESARRLAALLNFYDGVTCEEFSSTLSSQDRRAIISRFNAGKLDVVVCSDAMARGMDLERVENVISYDPPVAAQTYVHRVGRTARAGATGTSFVLLRRQEVLHFKRLRQSIDNRAVQQIALKADDYAQIPGDYDAALTHLKQQVTTQPSSRRYVMTTVHESMSKHLVNCLREARSEPEAAGL